MNIRSIRDPYLKQAVEAARENGRANAVKVQLNLHGKVDELPPEVAALAAAVVDELAANALAYVRENSLKGYEINVLPNALRAAAKGKPGLVLEVANPVRLRFDPQAIEDFVDASPAESGLARIREQLDGFRCGQWQVGWKRICRRGAWFAGASDTALHRDYFIVQLFITGPKPRPKRKPPAGNAPKKRAKSTPQKKNTPAGPA